MQSNETVVITLKTRIRLKAPTNDITQNNFQLIMGDRTSYLPLFGTVQSVPGRWALDPTQIFVTHYLTLFEYKYTPPVRTICSHSSIFRITARRQLACLSASHDMAQPSPSILHIPSSQSLKWRPLFPAPSSVPTFAHGPCC